MLLRSHAPARPGRVQIMTCRRWIMLAFGLWMVILDVGCCFVLDFFLFWGFFFGSYWHGIHDVASREDR